MYVCSWAELGDWEKGVHLTALVSVRRRVWIESVDGAEWRVWLWSCFLSNISWYWQLLPVIIVHALRLEFSEFSRSLNPHEHPIFYSSHIEAPFTYWHEFKDLILETLWFRGVCVIGSTPIGMTSEETAGPLPRPSLLREAAKLELYVNQLDKARFPLIHLPQPLNFIQAPHNLPFPPPVICQVTLSPPSSFRKDGVGGGV